MGPTQEPTLSGPAATRRPDPRDVPRRAVLSARPVGVDRPGAEGGTADAPDDRTADDRAPDDPDAGAADRRQ